MEREKRGEAHLCIFRYFDISFESCREALFFAGSGVFRSSLLVTLRVKRAYILCSSQPPFIPTKPARLPQTRRCILPIHFLHLRLTLPSVGEDCVGGRVVPEQCCPYSMCPEPRQCDPVWLNFASHVPIGQVLSRAEQSATVLALVYRPPVYIVSSWPVHHQ